jgi:DNA-3-methyladenine glycosylase II
MVSPKVFNAQNFKRLCNGLAGRDVHLKQVISQYGHPPLWTRPASFETLILIILEQQVSLASAYAAYKKLKEKTGNRITPPVIAEMSDEDLRACYFTRQKTGYARGLATAILDKRLQLRKLDHEPDDVIRTELKKLKGIGDWTVDIYLMQSLQRTDVFPLGDLALVKGMKEIKQLPPETTKEELLTLAELWRPYRSLAAMLCWHHYIKTRNIKIAE